MKRSLAAVVALLTVALSACGPSDKAHEGGASPAPAAKTGDGSPVAATNAPINIPSASTAAPAPADDAVRPGDAPAFAAIYPGGVVEAPATLASGPAGPGGLVTFTTEATPEAVIGFYKQRAEAAGLAPVMSLNRGETIAYGAAEPASGATLQVVATAAAAAPTSVQLTWSAGQ